MARKINFLAQDSKPGPRCLPRSSVARSGWNRLCFVQGRIFHVFRAASGVGARSVGDGAVLLSCRSDLSQVSPKAFLELRITRAYIRLLCLPEGQTEAREISVARIGNREIRLIEDPRCYSENPPLFWMELFDHDARVSINSCACHEIEDAVVVFEEFVADSEHLQKWCSRNGNPPRR
jgi:hypothetical protein